MYIGDSMRQLVPTGAIEPLYMASAVRRGARDPVLRFETQAGPVFLGRLFLLGVMRQCNHSQQGSPVI